MRRLDPTPAPRPDAVRAMAAPAGSDPQGLRTGEAASGGTVLGGPGAAEALRRR